MTTETTTIDAIGEMFDTATNAIEHVLETAVHAVEHVEQHASEATAPVATVPAEHQIATEQVAEVDEPWHQQAAEQLVVQHEVAQVAAPVVQQHTSEVVATAPAIAAPVTTTPVAVTVTVQPQVTLAPAHHSKKEIAAQIYVDMTQRKCPRKDIIAEMMKEANLSFNGASTYYQQFKSGVANLSNVKPRVERPDYTTMSIDDLLKFYNEHAQVKLHGFLCHEDGVKMIEAYVINM